MRPCARLLALMLGATFLVSCERETAPSLMNPVEGQPEVGFVLPDNVGIIRNMEDYRDKTLLINFWATWCEPCREEMPALSRLHQDRAGKKFRVIAIHVGPGEVEKFLEEVPVSFPILLDEQLEMTDWNVTALPTSFLISPEGKMQYKAIGVREWDAEEAHEFFDAVATAYSKKRRIR